MRTLAKQRSEVNIDDIDVDVGLVMPVQFVDRQFQAARLQPEKHLQLAVLADAVATYARSATETTSCAQRLYFELDEWFACDAAAGPFSLIGICDSLGIEPGYVRRGLRRLQRIDGSLLGRTLTLRHQAAVRHRIVRAQRRMA